jgi:hypothetical protein
MTDLYLYLDETGDMSMSNGSYYGLGQAMFRGDTGGLESDATKLRFELEREGVHLRKGFHAKNDKSKTAQESRAQARVYDLIARHKPRIDVTLLHKRYLPAPLKEEAERDQMNLYYWAWLKHFTYQAKYVLKRSHRIFVVAASIAENKKRRQAATAAIKSVLNKYPRLDVTPCIWDSPTSWGLQVADYALWAVQRDLIYGSCRHFKTISPLIETVYSPWEENGSKVEFRPAAESRRLGRPIPALIFNRHHASDRSSHERTSYSTKNENEFEEFQEAVPLVEDDDRTDDPLANGLWGAALWSDDEPWQVKSSDPMNRI